MKTNLYVTSISYGPKFKGDQDSRRRTVTMVLEKDIPFVVVKGQTFESADHHFVVGQSWYNCDTDQQTAEFIDEPRDEDKHALFLSKLYAAGWQAHGSENASFLCDEFVKAVNLGRSPTERPVEGTWQ